MSGISNYILNQKINAILGKTSGLPSVIDLDTTLTTGNNAGANDIDMNNNDILQVNNIDLTTINGKILLLLDEQQDKQLKERKVYQLVIYQEIPLKAVNQ
jgi:hypothetical protein